VVRHGTLCQRRSESAEIWRWRGSGYPGWLIHGSGSRPLAHSPWIWFPRRTAWMGFWRWVWFPEPSGSERPDGVTSPPRCGRTTVPPRRRSPGRWRNGLGFRAIAKAITPTFRRSIAGAGRDVQALGDSHLLFRRPPPPALGRRFFFHVSHGFRPGAPGLHPWQPTLAPAGAIGLRFDRWERGAKMRVHLKGIQIPDLTRYRLGDGRGQSALGACPGVHGSGRLRDAQRPRHAPRYRPLTPHHLIPPQPQPCTQRLRRRAGRTRYIQRCRSFASSG